jgi:magnesium-transporting ATPase (P-type)
MTAYWALDAIELARQLSSGADGPSDAEAARRLREDGPNELRDRQRLSRLDVLVRQVCSPLLLPLVFAAAASVATAAWLDAAIVLTIVVATVVIGCSREYRAQAAAAALGARLRTHATVVRDSRPRPVPAADLVAGDVVLLSAGSRGVEEGRTTFANTLRYVLITTSANLGSCSGSCRSRARCSRPSWGSRRSMSSQPSSSSGASIAPRPDSFSRTLPPAPATLARPVR